MSSAISLRPASTETLDAYRQLASMPAMVQAIVDDLQEQIPGDFCPDNQYVTAHNLGSLRILQILSVRLAEGQNPKPSLPEHSSHG